MSWIKINGKWQEKTKVMTSNQNERKQLEKRRNTIIKEIKNTSKNTKIPTLKKTINQFEKVQKTLADIKLSEQKVACIIKGKGVITTERNACKKKGKILKIV